MNKSDKLLIYIILILLCLRFIDILTNKPNWLDIIAKGDNKYYVDINSIKINRKANTVQFWEKIVYPTGQTFSLHLYNYHEQSYIILKLIEYDSKGSVIFESSMTSEKYHVVPGSVYDAITNEILRRH